MARRKRIDYPGAWHHVMNRGARRDAIFLSDNHGVVFLNAIGDMVERFGIEVHAYALMPNHYHLLVRSIRGNLSMAMQFFGARYSRQINRLHGWDGPIFKGRFHSEVVSDERYLRQVVPYIHLNPCKAGLVILPKDFIWSSYAAYIGESTPHPWLTRQTIIDLFGSEEAVIRSTEELRTLRKHWDPGINQDTGFFIGRIERYEDERNRTPGPKISPDVVLAVVCKVTSSSKEKILAQTYGRSANPRRRLYIWALRRHGGLTYTEIGRLTGSSAVSVGQILSRIRHNKIIPSPLLGWMEEIDELARVKTAETRTRRRH